MNGAKNISLNKKNNNLLKIFIGAVALFLFLAVLNLFSAPIKNGFFALNSPMQKVFWSAGESGAGFFTSFVKAGGLSKENQNLKNQVQQLYAQVASLQTIINGNQAQSEVSQACQNNSFKLLMVGTTGLENDMLSINKGSADGVAENMPVISQQGALFGKVFKVYKNYSQVMLISNKNSVISVKVQQSGINGVVKGQGALKILFDLVPIDQTISQNDVLVTSALEGIFPKDLLVGTITKVVKNDQDPHQQAQVQPFLNPSIDNLFVILNYKR